MGIKQLKLIAIGAISLMVSGCYEAPRFDNTPFISFEGIEYKRPITATDTAILKVTVEFQDGDGDLGLGGQEFEPPFNQHHYFSNKTGTFFDFDNEGLNDLLIYGNRDIVDSLPDYVGLNKCLNYTTTPSLYFDNGDRVEDTVYYKPNHRYYNIYVKFFIEENGEFREFDLVQEFGCNFNTPYHGRFPILKDDMERAISGTLSYKITSSVDFKTIYGANQNMQLQVYILDRAGNVSNMITTPTFTLSDIQTN